MSEKIVVDFKAENTEVEWLNLHDRFWLTFTPKLFEWLSWIALLAGVMFVQKKTGSIALIVIAVLCSMSIAMYTYSAFARLEFTGFLNSRPKLQRWVSILLSTALASTAYLLAIYTRDALAISSSL